MSTPRVTVVVTSHGAYAELTRTLSALLDGESPDEVIVAEGGPADPQTHLHRFASRVRILHMPGAAVPRLRWTAARASTGDIIVTTEARLVPDAGWWQALRDAHVTHPECRVIGGVVDVAPDARACDRGLYLCEYVSFAPAREPGVVATLSSGSLSYRREVLLAEGDLLDRGCWDTVLHARWATVPSALRLVPARSLFVSGMTRTAALRMRFRYGRSYATERVRSRGVAARTLFAGGTLLLPWLLTLRVLNDAGRYRSAALDQPALGWAWVYNVAWAAGECVGYLAGSGGDEGALLP